MIRKMVASWTDFPQTRFTASWKMHLLQLNGKKNNCFLTVQENGRQHFDNNIQWKQKFKNLFFWLKDKAIYEDLSIKCTNTLYKY